MGIQEGLAGLLVLAAVIYIIARLRRGAGHGGECDCSKCDAGNCDRRKDD